MILGNLINCLINFKLYFYFTGRGEVWSSRLPVTQEVAGSNPVVPALGQIAQSVEHLSEKQGVGSSILPLATNTYKSFLLLAFFKYKTWSETGI